MNTSHQPISPRELFSLSVTPVTQRVRRAASSVKRQFHRAHGHWAEYTGAIFNQIKAHHYQICADVEERKVVQHEANADFYRDLGKQRQVRKEKRYAEIARVTARQYQARAAVARADSRS